MCLASLRESYDTLVTALQAQSDDTSKWDVVRERLLQEEQRKKDRYMPSGTDDKKVFLTSRLQSDHPL